MKHIALILLLLASPLWAVEPHEMLDDPILEARAQALDDELRCVRCRSESIAFSQADWAADARVLVRELLTEGKSDQEVLDFFVARYGEFVLMRPPAKGGNLVLWLSAPALLLVGLGISVAYLRQRRQPPPAPEALSPEDAKRLRELTKD
ncbi:MAG: cytochrome c-type biogenesis protein [Pseudomonadota bacterium]